MKIALLNFVNKKYINYYSEIHLVIQGKGEQQIFYNYFNTEPSEVYINVIKNVNKHFLLFIKNIN